jgi:hypothetical protein
MQPDLLTTCGIAFGAVLVVLGSLAVIIRLLTTLFPDDSPEADPVLMKAIEDAVGQAFPGSSVVSVELDKKD